MSLTPASGRKDQSIRREVLRDIAEEVPIARSEPHLRNPNRDQARGDWDRTGRHGDEGKSRSEI
jgi:hypothetical protein